MQKGFTTGGEIIPTPTNEARVVPVGEWKGPPILFASPNLNQKKEIREDQGLSHLESPSPQREVGPYEGIPEAEVKQDDDTPVVSDESISDVSDVEIEGDDAWESSRGG